MNFKEKIKNLISKTNRFTQTDNVYIARFGSYLISANILNLGLSFILSVAFGRFISKELFGSYQYVLSIYSLLTILSLPEMTTAVNQSTALGYEGSIFSAIKSRLRWSLLGSLAFISTAFYFKFNSREFLFLPLIVTGLLFPLCESFKTYSGYLSGKKRFDINSVLGVLNQLAYVITITLIMIFAKNLLTMVIGFLAISTVGSYVSFKQSVRIDGPKNNKIDPDMIGYGKKLTFASILSSIASNIDRILGFTMFGGPVLASYIFATIPIDKSKAITSPLGDLMFPKLASKDEVYKKTTIYKRLLQMSILALAMIVGWYFLAPLAYRIFLPAYSDSVPLSRLYSLIWIGLPFSILPTLFQAQKVIKAIYAQNILNPIFKITAIFFLGRAYGIEGFVWANILTAAFRSILALSLLWLHNKNII